MFIGCEPPANAELLEATIWMEKAMELQIKKFRLESDCSIVVNAFYNHALVPWNLRSRWLVCWAYMMNVDFRITHIFRETNFCADILARIGLDCNSIIWFQHVH